MRKKFIAGILAGAIFFTPIEIGFSFDAPVAEAAKFGGIRAPKSSAPKVNLQKNTPAKSSATQSDGQRAVSGSGAKGQYQPSKNPKDLQRNAPASPTTSTGSRWGNALRNIGLFAGGMFLGSMLASMFGFGGGIFGDILGALANVILFGALIMLAMWAWRKFKNRNSPDPVPYQDQTISTRFDSQSSKIGVDYDAKRAADFYRNR